MVAAVIAVMTYDSWPPLGGIVHPLFPALIENSLDLTAALDETGTIVYQSPSALRLLGYHPRELVGQNAFTFVHPADHQRVRDAFERGRREDGPTPFIEYRFLHKTNGWRVLESVGSAVDLPGGRRIGIVNSRDISEQRALKDQVHHAQHIATLGRMATSLVHEFHNSLQVMLLHLDMIFETNDSPDLVPELEGIKRAGEVAQSLARQVLDISRTSGAAPQRIDVNAGIADRLRILQRLAGRGVRIETRLRATRPEICARFGVLDQVLINLVSNARDAIRDSGTITIATRNRDDELIIEVADTGTGIPLRLQGQIFEPFVTTKSATNGTGLGLSAVREIVEEAGGRIHVASAIGCGATFTIVLPTAEAAVIGDCRKRQGTAA